jgi:hypothetical protein
MLIKKYINNSTNKNKNEAELEALQLQTINAVVD